MKNVLIIFIAVMASVIFSPCYSATSSLYGDFASWSAAVGGSYIMQDFDSYVHGTDLYGVDVLSGVNFTSNMASIIAWSVSSDPNLFGLDPAIRQQGIAYYDINFNLPYCAVAFDVEAWNPEDPGPAVVEILFSDQTKIFAEYYQTGPTEDTPVFFGITSDTAITRIRWHECFETGSNFNEEVAFDNLAVSRMCIPEPSLIVLSGFSLLLFIGQALKRKAQ